MIELIIIALSVFGTLLVSKIVLDEIRYSKMEKTVDNLAQCFLTYITNPESVDIIEDRDKPTKRSGSGFPKFPNSEGF